MRRLFFIVRSSVENGWGRDDLELAIKNRYLKAKGQSITNFTCTLPKVQSALAEEETRKNPYNFDFLGLKQDAMEREFENARRLGKISY